MRRLFSIASLLFSLPLMAEPTVCTPIGQACQSSISCCDGNCDRGVCVSLFSMNSEKTASEQKEIKGKALSCQAKSTEPSLGACSLVAQLELGMGGSERR